MLLYNIVKRKTYIGEFYVVLKWLIFLYFSFLLIGT